MLSIPLMMMGNIIHTIKELEAIFSKDGGTVDEQDREKVIMNKTDILGGLIEVRTDDEIKKQKSGCEEWYETRDQYKNTISPSMKKITSILHSRKTS